MCNSLTVWWILQVRQSYTRSVVYVAGATVIHTQCGVCCRCDSHSVVDAAFYDADTVSLLLQENTEEQTAVLAQLPLSVLHEHFVATKEQYCMSTLIEQQV